MRGRLVLCISLLACADDPCAAMCAAAVPAYADCLSTWDADWSDAGYADAADFEAACATWAWEQRLMEREANARGETSATCAERAAALRTAPSCERYQRWDWNTPITPRRAF